MHAPTHTLKRTLTHTQQVSTMFYSDQGKKINDYATQQKNPTVGK